LASTTHIRTRLAKEEARAPRAMVATKDLNATRAGLDILEAGGNAIDAAVAACFAIGVVEPTSSGIGGGGYLVYQMGEKGGVIGFPMRGPLLAQPDMYKLTGEQAVGGFGWPGVEGDENIEGYRSIATPGAVAGLCEAHKLHGRLPLSEVLAPSVSLARDGFSPSWFNVYCSGLEAGKLLRYTELRKVFMPDEKMPKGDLANPTRFCQADLADVLETIGRDGPKAFYSGDVARAIVSDIQGNGGILSEKDLTEYRPFVWEDGLEVSYKGHTVRVPPFACAGTTSAMTLKTLDGFDIGSMGHNSANMLHAYIGSARLAYADRFAYMADPTFVEVPWNGLVSDTYTERRRDTLEQNVPASWEPGDPWVDEGRRPETVLSPSLPALDNGTTHLCTFDSDGNAVSLTNTLMSGFGSGIVPAGTGISMNNGMMWFDPVPGRVNSIAPGKYPLNNMTPALVLNSDGVYMAVGASGGRRITNCVTQIIIKTLDFGIGPQEAIDSPRLDCSTPTTSVDPRMDESVTSDLESRGHKLLVMGENFGWPGFGSFASPVAIVRGNDQLLAGVDTFHSAYAAGL